MLKYRKLTWAEEFTMDKIKKSKQSRRQFFSTTAKSSLFAWTMGFPSKEGFSNPFFTDSSKEKDPKKPSWMAIENELYGAN